MSLADADRLLSGGSGDAALVYLYILRTGGRLDAESAAKTLRLRAPLREALGELVALGLVRAAGSETPPPPAPLPEKKPVLERADTPPDYSVADVKRRVDEGSPFGPLLDEVAARLGRVLSGGDMTILFGIYDYLGLPPEVILLLIGWCTQEQERRYGAGKKPSLRQIEKEAYAWARNELYSLEEAETYLQNREARQKKSAEVRRLLGLRDRPLSPTEEKYVMSWLEMGFDNEAILKAYDRTVLNKKDLVWPYMNSILTRWHQKGLHSTAEIEAGDGRPRNGTPRNGAPGNGAPGNAAGGKDAKPAPAELDRMRKYLDKLNGGEHSGT